jgi:alanine dehydrogenase
MAVQQAAKYLEPAHGGRGFYWYVPGVELATVVILAEGL